MRARFELLRALAICSILGWSAAGGSFHTEGQLDVCERRIHTVIVVWRKAERDALKKARNSFAFKSCRVPGISRLDGRGQDPCKNDVSRGLWPCQPFTTFGLHLLKKKWKKLVRFEDMNPQFNNEHKVGLSNEYVFYFPWRIQSAFVTTTSNSKTSVIQCYFRNPLKEKVIIYNFERVYRIVLV